MAAALALGATGVVAPVAAAATSGLATGRAGHGSTASYWTVHGRHVVVRFATSLARVGAGPKTGPLHGPTVAVRAQCSDDTHRGLIPVAGGGELGYDIGLAADQTFAPPRHVAASDRTVRATLSRDIASRINRCVLRVGRTTVPAHVTLRRGQPPGCRPARLERPLDTGGPARVFFTYDGGSSDAGPFAAWRACLPGDPRARPLLNGDGVVAGQTFATGFRSGGTWLAWVLVGDNRDGTAEESAVAEVDLAHPTHDEVVHPGDDSPVVPAGTVSSLVIASDGVLAWIAEDVPRMDPNVANGPVTLVARRPGRRPLVLDHAPAAAALSTPVVSGAVVSWTNGGVPHRASVP